MKTTDAEKVINEIRLAIDRGEAVEVRPLPDEPQAFEMDLVQAWRTLLTNWKRIVLITLLFAVVGVIGGTIYYVTTPRETIPPKVDLYTGVEIEPEDAYGEIFSNVEQYHNEINTYIDAMYNSVKANDYDGKEADIKFLNELRENLNGTYESTFLLGKGLNELYSPVRDNDIEKELIALELRQKYISNEIVRLQQELSYLSSIAAVGTSAEGPATDAAIAAGVDDASLLATYQQEHEDNTQLINELTGAADNSERVQQKQRIDNLIQDGISANERFVKELNQFVVEYSERQKVSITISQVPNADNPEKLNYTVMVEENDPQPTPYRIPKAIALLLTCIGFGLGCLWVLWKNYKPEQKQLS